MAEFDDIGDLMASYLDDDAPLVAFDTRLAVAADRPVLRGLEMGMNSYWPGFSTDEAEDLQVFNRERLLQAIEGNTLRVVAFTDWDLSLISRATPPNLPGSRYEEEWPFRVLPELKRWYSLAHTVSDYGPFGGKLYILVRRPF